MPSILKAGTLDIFEIRSIEKILVKSGLELMSLLLVLEVLTQILLALKTSYLVFSLDPAFNLLATSSLLPA